MMRELDEVVNRVSREGSSERREGSRSVTSLSRRSLLMTPLLMTPLLMTLILMLSCTEDDQTTDETDALPDTTSDMMASVEPTPVWELQAASARGVLSRTRVQGAVGCRRIPPKPWTARGNGVGSL